MKSRRPTKSDTAAETRAALQPHAARKRGGKIVGKPVQSRPDRRARRDLGGAVDNPIAAAQPVTAKVPQVSVQVVPSPPPVKTVRPIPTATAKPFDDGQQTRDTLDTFATLNSLKKIGNQDDAADKDNSDSGWTAARRGGRVGTRR